jgi:hypothetical protein
MAGISLPDRANLTQLRKQARDLQRAVRAGSAEARDEVARYHPAGAPDVATFSLSAARLVISRRYGFSSWTRLKHHVETREHYTRIPPQGEVGAGLGDEFLRLGCLWYEDDQPERWARARALLAAQPELTRGHVHAASAAADVATLRAILGADPGAARREGGPYRAEPLYYLAYARHDPQLSQDAVLTSARLLLAAGADPNAGYFWRGLPTPFTVLTGVLGHGELGPDRQPPHPHAPALARLLLESGADPNDAQALYNRMFEPGQEHLELLLEFGLGRGDGGPWRARLGDAQGSPAELVRGQLEWAVTHGLADRVRLLGRHGVDVTSRAPGRQSRAELAPIELALTTGHAELVEVLAEFGAGPAELDPDEAMVARLLAGDQAGAESLERDNPLALEEVKLTRPGLIVWAAVLGRTSAVDLIAGLGFDVNAKARTDGPGTTEWETALHHTARAGNLALARRLVELGADPDVRDHRFGSTPLGWAQHFGQPELIAFLDPLTSPEPAAD